MGCAPTTWADVVLVLGLIAALILLVPLVMIADSLHDRWKR